MRTITIPDETAAFLIELNHRLKTQDNRATADPYYFTVRCVSETPVPDGFTDEIRYVHDGTPFTEEELKKYCEENELEFEQFKSDKCSKYCVRDTIEFKNFFFTEEGYNEHIRLNGHNYGHYKEVSSYVDHAFRNPEIEQLLAAVKGIGKALCEECQFDDLETVVSIHVAEKEKGIRDLIYKNVCSLGIEVKDNAGGMVPKEEMTVDFIVGVLVSEVKKRKHNQSMEEALNRGDGSYSP